MLPQLSALSTSAGPTKDVVSVLLVPVSGYPSLTGALG
jgi:hypothetical protein